MKCCNCNEKLDLRVILSGVGSCSFCGAKQRIKTKHTLYVVLSILFIFLFLNVSVYWKLLMSLILGGIYLCFSAFELDEE